MIFFFFTASQAQLQKRDKLYRASNEAQLLFLTSRVSVCWINCEDLSVLNNTNSLRCLKNTKLLTVNVPLTHKEQTVCRIPDGGFLFNRPMHGYLCTQPFLFKCCYRRIPHILPIIRLVPNIQKVPTQKNYYSIKGNHKI